MPGRFLVLCPTQPSWGDLWGAHGSVPCPLLLACCPVTPIPPGPLGAKEGTGVFQLPAPSCRADLSTSSSSSPISTAPRCCWGGCAPGQSCPGYKASSPRLTWGHPSFPRLLRTLLCWKSMLSVLAAHRGAGGLLLEAPAGLEPHRGSWCCWQGPHGQDWGAASSAAGVCRGLRAPGALTPIPPCLLSCSFHPQPLHPSPATRSPADDALPLKPHPDSTQPRRSQSRIF